MLGLLCNNIDFHLACFLCIISLGASYFHSMQHHLIENNCNLFNLRVPQLDPEVTNWTPTDRIYLQLCVRREAGQRSSVGSKRRSAASSLSRLVVILLGDLVSLGGGKVFNKHLTNYFHTARRQQLIKMGGALKLSILPCSIPPRQCCSCGTHPCVNQFISHQS